MNLEDIAKTIADPSHIGFDAGQIKRVVQPKHVGDLADGFDVTGEGPAKFIAFYTPI